jgi:hypothetical protein
MDASFRWYDDGFYNWVFKLTHYPPSQSSIGYHWRSRKRRSVYLGIAKFPHVPHDLLHKVHSPGLNASGRE